MPNEIPTTKKELVGISDHAGNWAGRVLDEIPTNKKKLSELLISAANLLFTFEEAYMFLLL